MDSLELEDWEVKQTVQNPEALYVAVIGNGDYRRSAEHIEGDSEFVTTSWIYKQKAICCVMVHSVRKAYPLLLSLVDLEECEKRINFMRTGLQLNALS